MYGLCVLVGIALSVLLIWIMTKKRKDYSKIHIIDIPLFAAIGAFLGAHLMYGVTQINVLFYILGNFNDFFSSWNRAWELLGELFGGMVFYGGLFGALAGAAIYCKIKKLDFMFYADIYAPAIPLFHAFGRLGCFFAGCCYGIESPWGVIYHNELLPEENGVTRLPIQLIEAGLNLIIMLVLILMSRKKMKKGTLLCSYFIIYAVVRFTDEFFRGDIIRGILFGLSTSQWLSIILFIVGTVMLLKRYVIKKTKDNYGTRVDIGVIPQGYAYNKYSGAITLDQTNEIKYGKIEYNPIDSEHHKDE